MDIAEIVNLVVNTGGTGVVVYLLLKQNERMEQQQKQIWTLLEWLVKGQRHGDATASDIWRGATGEEPPRG